MWSCAVSVASAAYAGSQRIVALSDARADLIAEYSPGKVTDECLNWVDVVGTGDVRRLAGELAAVRGRDSALLEERNRFGRDYEKERAERLSVKEELRKTVIAFCLCVCVCILIILF